MEKIEYFKNKGVNVLLEMPKGWRKIEGAVNAPCGYIWVCNNKSLFSGEYKQALLKI